MVDFQVGDSLQLRGKTLKGKNRVHERGDTWIVKNISEGTPWIEKGMLFIEPWSGGDSRWIKPTNDPHFEIIDKFP